jgi:D-beta-D-heptose 7-phosphate kinase/D-beta-D-heptose 1-phosphate adenosyltransferase
MIWLHGERIVERFPGLRVTVIGDAILDRFVECAARKLCTEAPVPVVRRRGEVLAPGGAANVAANLAALGARPTLVAATGADDAGRWLRAELSRRGVGVDHLITEGGFRTHQKTRIVADGQYLVRLDDGETAPAGPPRETAEAAVRGADAVVLSDYALGVLDPRLVAHLARLRISAPVVVDAKRPPMFRRLRPSAVTPNLDEATALAGDGVELEALARRVRRQTGAGAVALTLGSRGAYLLAGDGPGELVPARPARPESEVGAGDSFAAALGLGLAAGAGLRQAVTIAVEAAGIAVAKRHTAVVHADELARSLALAQASARSDTPEATALATLLPALEERRRRGQRVVFTNGVFDLLHAGHVDFLRRARRLGDALVVAVNSDRTVRRLKGSGRPVATEEERVSLLAAIDCVDHVLVFGARTASALLRRIRPDVYVKGGDYTLEDLPEAETARQLGTEVVILPRTLPASTTSLIRRVRELSARQARADTA